MARGLRRGPVLLRFRSLVDSVAHYVAGIVDTRQLSIRDCYLRPSLYFSSRTLGSSSRVRWPNNLSSTFARFSGVDPSCAIYMTAMTISPSCPASPTGSVQRCKWLQHYQIFGARYLITLDGSRYFSSEAVHCAHCLTTTKNGTTRYHHAFCRPPVHPDKRQVLPLAPEFVRNSDADGGNYCEIGRLPHAGPAPRRLSAHGGNYRRRQLYSKQPCVEQLTAKRFSFLLVAKPGDHKSLYQDLAVLRRANLLDRHTTEHRQERREYEWITDLPLNANPTHRNPLAHRQGRQDL